MAVRALSADLEAVAYEKLNEDPKRTDEDLKHIRDWLAKQPHLTARKDSQWLTTILRCAKFSLERTKTKLEMFYTMRTALPEVYANRDPMLPELQHILKLGVTLPLPLPDDQGRRVIIQRLSIYNPEEVKLVDVAKEMMMKVDVMLEEDDRSIICGIVIILDYTNSTLAHVMQYNPSFVKKMITTFLEGYDIHPKGIHLVHTSSAMTTVINMIKSLLKEKMKQRFFVHANLDSLYEHVPKRCLPQEYGGEGGQLDRLTEEWKKKTEARRAWFLDDEKNRSDETKRPGGRPKTQEDLFGLEGSFRQLNVD